jgi:hypothetical protein
MKYIAMMILVIMLAGCAGHKLENYDVGLNVGETEFSGDTDTKKATTANVRVNFHFGVK